MRTSLFLTCLALAGCTTTQAPVKHHVASDGGDPADSLDAKQYYIQEVDPSFARDCKICHATGQNGAPTFMDTNAEASYAALRDSERPLVTAPENSELILHGAHTGPALSDAELMVVTKWLEKEQGDASTSGPTLKDALKEFGECMVFDDFMNTGMYKLGEPVSQSTAGPCAGCHSTGQAGAWISATSAEMFARNRKIPWIKRLVTGTVDANKQFKDLVPANRFIDKGDPTKEPCKDEDAGVLCHPQSALDQTVKDSISQFVDMTLARWRSRSCAPDLDAGTDGG